MLTGRYCAALALLALIPGVVPGQTGGAGVSGGPGYNATEVLPPGAVISGVEIRVSDVADPVAQADLADRVRQVLAIRPGSHWDPVLGAAALARVRSRPGVARVSLAGVLDRDGSGYRLIVDVQGGDARTTGPSGLLVEGGEGRFPELYNDGRRYLKIELSGGHGLFSDGNPWFGRPEVFTAGNPLVQDPAVGADTGDRATWTESFLQFGLAGATPLNDAGLYGFGAVSGVGVFSYGQDIFRDDTRSSIDLEKAYAGLLYAPEDTDLRLTLSVGRQNYSLNSGFLVSQFGSQWNAGPRPGVYLAPRTTQDMSVVASGHYRDWRVTFFMLDPNELESLESDTRLAGLNVAHATTGRWSWDLTGMYVPRSNTAYRAPDGLPRGREGLRTAAAHVRMHTRPRRPDFWLEAELAHQSHDDFDMSAWAGYGELGYYARDRRWTPSISYRLSGFSGDDPDTARYERFDTLYSGGLDHWLQGISINKLLTQTNRISHRVRMNVAPAPELNLTLDLYRHLADEFNNLGGNPALGTLESRDLGDEIQLVARWQVSRNVMVLGIASAAFPGRAIEAAAGGDADPWTTLQTQLFWGF
jgi:hypothetical protein